MSKERQEFGSQENNPLLTDSAESWNRLLEAVRPASILLVIEDRLGEALRRELTPEDVWQETLMYAWRDRERFEWRGLPSLRRWLITIATNRIREAAERAGAQKRGGGKAPVEFSAFISPSGNQLPVGLQSTTPSRVCVYREQASIMRAALHQLDEELQEVVRLRLFDDRTLEEVADMMAIGVSAVRHRLRRGAIEYEGHLARMLGEHRPEKAD